MKLLCFDVENTTRQINEKYRDFSPYCNTNKLVAIGWCYIEDGAIGEIKTVVLAHNDTLKYYTTNYIQNGLKEFKEALKHVDGYLAFNIKYDMQWLLESGFEVANVPLICGMIREYVMARGRSDISFSLADTCKRYKVAEKGELFEKYRDLQISEMPLIEVVEYLISDVRSCAELYLAQEERLNSFGYGGLRKTIDMMNEFCSVLVAIERNGVKIDEEALNKVELEFKDEQEKLIYDINVLIKQYVGDTPINLDSPKQLSEVIYSRRIREGKEDEWLNVFNVGKDDRGKNLRRPKMSYNEYATHVKSLTHPVLKTTVKKCEACFGVGKIHKTKKDGEPFKKQTKCKDCFGLGAIYVEQNEIAGFRMKPKAIAFTTINGFSTSKGFLDELIAQAEEDNKPDAKVFLEKLQRLSSVSSYLSNFVDGIRTFKQVDTILHPNFNQCITATGRLSSTKPNLQNQPREATFPIRKVFISRFSGGKVIDTDFRGLEFRAAVHLAEDENGKRDILNGSDIHKQTAEIISRVGAPITRQDAKSRCVPLSSLILSREGWKTYEQIQVGEDVLTYNSEQDINEWQPLLEKVYYSNKELIEISNCHWKMQCTPEHKWFGDKRIDTGKFGRMYKKVAFNAKDITTSYNIFTTAIADGGISDIAPKQAAILGWIWTDGSIRFSKITSANSQSNGDRIGVSAVIIQRPDKNRDVLKELLYGLSTEGIKDHNCLIYRLNSKYVRELYNVAKLDYYEPDYVKFVLSLSKKARSAFLTACIQAEGTNRGRGVVRISQNSGKKAEAIKLAAYMEGYDIRVSYSKLYTGNINEAITLRTRPYVTGSRLILKKIESADVWCPRTKNNSWVMKQGKFITITGNTFKPLFGGVTGTDAERVYYKAFLNELYPGVGKWHKKLQEEALATKMIITPTGRQFLFADVERAWHGGCTKATQVVNYPVQSFATADIVPIAIIRLYKEMKKRNLKSLIVLTVHDSVIVDAHPDEIDVIIDLVTKLHKYAEEELYNRYGINMFVPLDTETKVGDNLMQMKKVA